MTVTPTAIDAAARAKARAAILKNGGTHVLRQPTVVETQTGPGAGSVSSSPMSASGVAMNATAGAGAASVSLKKASVLSPDLSGLLVAGDVLTILGADYTVTGGPYAVALGVVGPVSIEPVLAEEVPANTGVSVTFSGTDKVVKGVRSMIETKFVDGEVTRTGDWQILFSALDLESRSITIREGDDLYLGDDPSTDPLAEVLRIARIPSGEQDAALWVFAREVRR